MKYILFGARGKHRNINKQNGKKIQMNILFSLGVVEIISLLRGVFLANHLTSIEN